MKIISIVGARPQFIKIAALCRLLNGPSRFNFAQDDVRRITTTTDSQLIPNPNSRITHLICHTGQHFDEEMSKLFFEQLDIPVPDYNLGISGGTQAVQTGKMLIEIEEVLLKEDPDLVIVFGDTNSTLAGSLAAVKLCINTVHIEAGLRSRNRSMPEEINRIITDHTSDFLFAPTKTAVENLTTEGLLEKTFLSGDIMVDSLRDNIEQANKYSTILAELNLKSNNYYLLTLHRPYNVDDPANLSLIFDKLSKLDKQIIFPVHPRTNKIIKDNYLQISENVKLIKPVGYLDFIKLEQNSEKILTDSGGIQKEAYIFKKPCITLRPETEWVETVTEGWNMLALPNEKDFCEKILGFNPTSKQNNIFGNDVAVKMVNKIIELFT